MISISIDRLTTRQAVQEILKVVLRIEEQLAAPSGGDNGQLTEIEAKIRANTEVLSAISSNPPEVEGVT